MFSLVYLLSLKVKSLIDIQDEEEEKHMSVAASLEPWKHYKFRVKIMHRLDKREHQLDAPAHHEVIISYLSH